MKSQKNNKSTKEVQQTITSKSRKTICLNMIVKNEALVIQRCLTSIKKFIDYWVIVDTGSSDGTQNVIKEYMKDIPGELHERPWVNFAYNRTEALSLAKDKANYLLLIDADEELICPENYRFPPLTADMYVSVLRDVAIYAHRAFLLNTQLDWSYEGVLHESVVCVQAAKGSVLPDILISADNKDGNRARDPQKFLKDAETLEKAIQKEPDNTRYVYYLGQSYLMAMQYEKALEVFIRRSKMPGCKEEIFWSKYVMGTLSEHLKLPSELIIQRYSEACAYNQTRAEPVHNLASYCRRNGNLIIAYTLSKHGLTIPKPSNPMLTYPLVYEYSMLWEFTLAAGSLGKKEEAFASCKTVLKKDIPEDIRAFAQNLLLNLR